MLALLIIDKIGLVPAFAVTLDAFQGFDLQIFREEVLKERISSLTKQLTLNEDSIAYQELKEEFSPRLTIPGELKKHFDRGGIGISEYQLGSGEGFAYPHPLRWTLNQFGEKLVDALALLENALREKQFSLDVLPVEYLPTISAGAYFSDRNDLKTQFHSLIVVQA
jgi:hypothetical protein